MWPCYFSSLQTTTAQLPLTIFFLHMTLRPPPLSIVPGRYKERLFLSCKQAEVLPCYSNLVDSLVDFFLSAVFMRCCANEVLKLLAQRWQASAAQATHSSVQLIPSLQLSWEKRFVTLKTDTSQSWNHHPRSKSTTLRGAAILQRSAEHTWWKAAIHQTKAIAWSTATSNVVSCSKSCPSANASLCCDTIACSEGHC